ncbi:MAG TPA: acyclic terpene utilization AtuA family protein [Streptosporangiaceae bacterium]|nr:acyclic terpene utilization AtuA family protein [Streptosporangiaceae bacterium]
MNRPVRIANCSGFYGDWLPAARQMVEGGPVDVLTGDYLAELTMLILWKARLKDPTAGYARTFLAQLEQILGTCLDRQIKIVVNAGGLNPAGLAEAVDKVAAGLGLAPRVAYVTGDDLLGRLPELQAAGLGLANADTGEPLASAGVQPVTANAYLGGWPITEALAAGADVVICPRVTDAALTSGPAAWWHGWQRTDWDALAGAVIAGHVIECGPQACGGNYPFLDEITDRRYPGFPVAEVAADGSAVITKHPGTGGLVSPGTVTAQLLYEIAGPDYPGPDVVAHFDTVRLTQEGPDRVLISGARGSPPPSTLKVALNYLGGYRNTMTLVLTGLDIEEKAAWARQELFGLLGGEDRFAAADVRLLRYDHPDAPANEQATAHLRITVFGGDAGQVGREFSDAVMALALGGYAGFHPTTPPTPATAYGVYWPTLVPAGVVEQAVILPTGEHRPVPHTGTAAAAPARPAAPASPAAAAGTVRDAAPAVAVSAAAAGPAVRVPLGRVAGARSGDKGGNANVGVWVRDPAAYGWLRTELTVKRLRALLPEAAGLEIHRFELPNLAALNFVIVGLLGLGVAASARPDPQAKGLGEYLRSRLVDVPAALLDGSAVACAPGPADGQR